MEQGRSIERSRHSLVIVASLFFSIALIVRFLCQEILQSRYQVAFFCLLAAVLEFFVAPALRFRRNWHSLLANCAAASFAIVLMKLIIEGPL